MPPDHVGAVPTPVEPDWRDVGDEQELMAAGMTCVNLGRHSILLVPSADGISALQNVCPHEHHYLHEGSLEGGVVECGAHGWQFDATTGAGIRPRGADLRRYEVRIADGRVAVAITRPNTTRG